MEKGANGTDSRFSSALKKEKVYVVTLSNEGGRNAFKTSGAERTLESVSSSDAEVQVRAPCTVRDSDQSVSVVRRERTGAITMRTRRSGCLRLRRGSRCVIG